MEENNEYKFKGKRLQPNTCKQLIIELFSSQTVKRQVIIKKVEDFHRKNRGRIPEKQSFKSLVKNTLGLLEKKGLADRDPDQFGYYIIHGDEQPREEYEGEEYEVEPKEEDSEVLSENADHLLGDGGKYVYMYYMPMNKEHLVNYKNQNIWPCKIGVADNSTTDRVKNQGTGHSEHPHFSIILCVDDNARWETTIHNILTIRGKKANTPGKEWFNTNPEEVLEIIRFIDPTIKNLP